MTTTETSAVTKALTDQARKAIARIASQPLGSVNIHYYDGQVAGLTFALTALGAPESLVSELSNAAYEAGKR